MQFGCLAVHDDALLLSPFVALDSAVAGCDGLVGLNAAAAVDVVY